MAYTNFAYIYDRLMYDIDYSKWANYIEEIFKRNKAEVSLLLDLGCGTGSFCLEMAKRGYDMIGIDISSDMLCCARKKFEDQGKDILLLNQDMTRFELYGTVDAVVCLMDSVNYITSKRDLKRMFKLVQNYLNPHGLFIFDINSAYKLEKVLADNVFYDVGEDIAYIWQNNYDRRSRICEFDLTFFVKEGEHYERYDEIHRERAYLSEEIMELIDASGLKLLDMYDQLSFSPPKDESERIFFVCRKE